MTRKVVSWVDTAILIAFIYNYAKEHTELHWGVCIGISLIAVAIINTLCNSQNWSVSRIGWLYRDAVNLVILTSVFSVILALFSLPLSSAFWTGVALILALGVVFYTEVHIIHPKWMYDMLKTEQERSDAIAKLYMEASSYYERVYPKISVFTGFKAAPVVGQYDNTYKQLKDDFIRLNRHSEEDCEEMVRKLKNFIDESLRLETWDPYAEANQDYNEADETGAPDEALAGFFKGCNDIASVKSRYRALCKVYHPDTGNGDTSTFEEIQSQYDYMLATMS